MTHDLITACAALMGIGALLVGMSFFLPWVSVDVAVGAIGVAGYDIARYEGYLYLVLLGALGGLAWAIYVGYRRAISAMTATLGFVSAVVPLVGLAILFLRLQNWMGLISAGAGAGLLSQLGYGFWITLLGTLLMLTAGMLAFTAVQPGMGQRPWLPDWGPDTNLPNPAHQNLSGGATTTPRREPTEIMGLQPKAEAWLVVRSGARNGQTFPLKRGDNTVGRDPARAEITVDDATVSGEHARVRYEGGQFYLYDLASRNGTYINDRRVQRQLLMDSDVVRLGSLEMVFKKV